VTDGRTDGQTDRIPIANTRLSSTAAGTAVARKNDPTWVPYKCAKFLHKVKYFFDSAAGNEKPCNNFKRIRLVALVAFVFVLRKVGLSSQIVALLNTERNANCVVTIYFINDC